MSRARAVPASRWLVGVLLFAALFWLLDVAVLRAGVPHPLDDTWEDAIIARLLLQGDWFRSHMLYPPLWSLHDPHTLTTPVLVHAPLLPLLMTLPVRLAGTGAIDGMAWFAALCAWLTLIPLFRLAARHFGDPVAAAAAALFTLSPLTIASVNHYGSVVLGALLITRTLDLLLHERPRAGLAGLAAGLAYLVRPEVLLAVPILALVILTRPSPDASRRDWGGLRRFVLAFVACGSWWWWHHWRSAGSPFFNLTSYLMVSFWPPYPTDALVRDFGVTPEGFRHILAEQWPHLWHKWVHFFPRAARRALLTPTVATGWLVPIGAIAALTRAESRRFAATALALAFIPIVAMTTLVPIWLYPTPFLPLYAIAAVLGARWLIERMPEWAHRPRLWIGLLAMVTIPTAVMQLRSDEEEARRLERWLALDRQALAGAWRTAENAARPMFSDTPDFVAWSTGRPTLWVTREEFERLAWRAASQGDSIAPGLALPRDPADTWFHRGDPRESENQRGARLVIRLPVAAPQTPATVSPSKRTAAGP